MGTTFTAEQTKQAQAYFKSIDADNSGHISLKELQDHLKLPSQEVKRLILSVDSDGNRRIDYNEYLSLFETRYRFVFNEIDKDKSGHITAKEFVNYLEGLGFKDKAAAEQYVKHVDSDGSGDLDFNEFVF